MVSQGSFTSEHAVEVEMFVQEKKPDQPGICDRENL